MSLPDVRTRHSARVLLIDRADRLLLFKCRAPEVAGGSVWITPGGRVEAGETIAEAAARELWEEAGVTVAPQNLGEVVAVWNRAWCVPDGRLAFNGANHYFVLRMDSPAVDTSQQTGIEQDVLIEHEWWTRSGLHSTAELIEPPGLPQLMDRLLAGTAPFEPDILPRAMPSERVRAAIIAGAVGDALGGAVEFSSLASIRERYGPDGVRSLTSNLITDDTQMTLFTAEGLLAAEPGHEVSSVYQAYLGWLGTQTMPEPPEQASGLAAEPWLYARRAPGMACLSGLENFDGGLVNPGSKGCGTVMRSAPFGLLGLGARRAFDLAADCSRLTHGHPTAGSAAGALAAIVNELVADSALQAAIDVALDLLSETEGAEETRAALLAAVELAETGAPSPSKVESLGDGWVAEEALAIGVYCALVAEYVWDGLLLAVNHSGDSDSTGSICGNLLGAERGTQEIPGPWVRGLEGISTISSTADQLAARRQENCVGG